MAAAGLLDGKCATTHWSRSADFARKFPKVRLDSDRIFIKDGKIWSSAGITAGIDLSLALVAEDLGELIARRTAQQLVVYYRRPGGQSQFSALLDMQHADGRFAELMGHIRANLADRLGVEDLAQHCNMSPRNFSRLFQAEIGVSPAKAVERLRVESAKAAFESGAHSNQRIARDCGFGTAERMRRSFVRGGELTLRAQTPEGSARDHTARTDRRAGSSPGMWVSSQRLSASIALTSVATRLQPHFAGTPCEVTKAQR